MYDRSLDLFAPHQPANPLALYPSRRRGDGRGSSLGASSVYGAGQDGTSWAIAAATTCAG